MNILTDKVKKELIATGENISSEHLNSFLEWMKVEYINYMLITREDAMKTLQKIKAICVEYAPLVDVLENNIHEYASLQCFYRVACDIKITS